MRAPFAAAEEFSREHRVYWQAVQPV